MTERTTNVRTALNAVSFAATIALFPAMCFANAQPTRADWWLVVVGIVTISVASFVVGAMCGRTLER
jgi:hypothetical protein